VAAYPTWQAWMRKTQPRMLVVWGKYDPSFDISEPEAYRRDIPDAEIHILNAGHFALDTEPDRIAGLVRAFLQIPIPKQQGETDANRKHSGNRH
jgi:pimeloyl-ACP methyl ester carboxylesterase